MALLQAKKSKQTIKLMRLANFVKDFVVDRHVDGNDGGSKKKTEPTVLMKMDIEGIIAYDFGTQPYYGLWRKFEFNAVIASRVKS